MAGKKATKLINELRALDTKQLAERLSSSRQLLVEHRRSHKAQELPSVAVLGKTRKEIAMIMTLLSEKQQTTTKENPS